MDDLVAVQWLADHLPELRTKVGSALDAERVITYCGAGAAASSLAHVLVRLGHPHVAIYEADCSSGAPIGTCHSKPATSPAQHGNGKRAEQANPRGGATGRDRGMWHCSPGLPVSWHPRARSWSTGAAYALSTDSHSSHVAVLKSSVRSSTATTEGPGLIAVTATPCR